MTTLLHAAVVVDRNGLVHACAWCLPRAQRDALNRSYRVSHGMCPACSLTLEAQFIESRKAA